MTYLTAAGRSTLEEELRDLQERRRPRLIKRLREARAQGDLKENADYQDTREQLGFLDGRVQEIEAVLRNAKVVPASPAGDEVAVGSRVQIQEIGEDEIEEYQIVGSAEADPRAGKISYGSPVGAALLGKKKGRKVTVKAPGGEFTYRIVKVN